MAALRRVLNKTLLGVRAEAARALRSIHTDDALEALLASTAQPDARVRRSVMEGVGGFYAETAYAALRRSLEQEDPDIQAVALRRLGSYPAGRRRPPRSSNSWIQTRSATN